MRENRLQMEHESVLREENCRNSQYFLLLRLVFKCAVYRFGDSKLRNTAGLQQGKWAEAGWLDLRRARGCLDVWFQRKLRNKSLCI